MVSKFKNQLSVLFAWINRRWILCTIVLTVVFWIISSNILIGFMVALFSVVFFIMIHAIIQLNQYKNNDK